jgi:hypothetical protein
MDASGAKPLRTKKQLKRSILKSVSLAAFVSVFPLLFLFQYNKFGFINIAKGYPPVTISGNNALVTIYGMALGAVFAWIIAAYFSVNCMMKILREEYSELDVASELVICNKCGEPQRYAELVGGHCRKCNGDVEDLEGYYDKHTQKTEQKPLADKITSQNCSIEMNTCIRCGETFDDKNPDSLCKFCLYK